MSDVRAPLAAWFALGVLVLVNLGALIDRNVLTVAMEPLRQSLHLSDVQIGLLQGLGLTLAAAAGSIPMAWLADRYDHRWVLAGCIVLWSAATAWRAFAQTFDVLFAASIGLAVTEACLAPIVYAMIPSLFHGRQRATANLVFYTLGVFGWSLATAISGLLLKFIAEAHASMPGWLQGLEPWRASFVAAALPGPLLAVLVLLIRHDSTPRAASGQRAASTDPASLREYMRKHGGTLLGIAGSTTFAALALGPVFVWLGVALTRQFDVSPADAGIRVGGALAAGTAMGIALAALTNKLWGERYGDTLGARTGQVFNIVAVAPLAALAFASSAQWLYGALVLLTISQVAYNALMPAVWQAMAPPHLRARVVAIVATVIVAGSAIGPLAVGVISDWLGPGKVLVAVALVGVPASIASAGLLRWVVPRLKATLALVPIA